MIDWLAESEWHCLWAFGVLLVPVEVISVVVALNVKDDPPRIGR